MTDEQLDAWRMGKAILFGKQWSDRLRCRDAVEIAKQVAREYHRLIATDARPVEDEAEAISRKALDTYCRTYNMVGQAFDAHCAVIRAALDKARSEATARAEKAERERDEANAVIAQIEKLPSVKMATAIQMIIAQRIAPEKGK